MKQINGSFRAILLLAAAFIAFGAAGADHVAAANGETKIVEHTVLKGDHLMLLAGYYFKDPRQWKQIYSENAAVLKDPHLILPGTVLRIATNDLDRWHIPYEEFADRAGN